MNRWLWVVLFAAAPCFSFAGERWRDMIPAPKEARVAGTDWVLPTDARIVIDDFPKAKIGAEEINLRIEELGGKRLDVRSTSAEGAAKLEIRIGVAGPVPEGGAPPAKQGYRIFFREAEGQRAVFLVGDDEMGALYACVTLRWLLEKGSNGVSISRVEIRDRPDFKWRGGPSVLFHAGNLPAQLLVNEKKAEALKKRIDWYFRRKINVLRDYAYLKPGALPDKPIPWIAEINRYAKERGFLTFVYQSTAIGNLANSKGKPFVERCFLSGHRRYFTWADDALLKARAVKVAKLCKDNGFNLLALHPPDGGGPVDPSGWYRRSDYDRKRWRDDQRAEADAHVFNTFYREARKLQPDIRVAYTVYPYSVGYFDYDILKKTYADLTHEMHRKNVLDYWPAIARLIPEDVHLIVWHGYKEQMDRYRKIFAPRPACYWGDFAGRWHRQPYFTSVARYIPTNFYDHDEDIPLAMHDRVMPNIVNVLSTVEFEWNTKTPGVELFKGFYWDLTEDTQRPRVIFERFVPRACANIWGPEAGPLMAPLFQHGLSAALLARTGTALDYQNRRRRHRGLPDIVLDSKMLKGQVDAAAKALPGLQKILDERPPMDPFAFRTAVYYYRRVRLLDVLARVRYHITWGSELADADRDAKAAEQLEAGENLLAEELPRLREMAAETAKLPHHTRRFHDAKRDRYSLLTKYDLSFDPYRKGLAGLRRRLDDKGRKIEPMQHTGTIEVGVYCGAKDGGSSIGHEGALMTFQDKPGIAVEYVTDLSLDSLLKYDCIIYPQGTLGHSSTRYDFFTGLRRYVVEGGGAVWFMHDATGSLRSEFGSKTVFPEVCLGAARRVDSNKARVIRNPIAKGFAEDAVIEHTYYDHWRLRRNHKKAGRNVLLDEENGAVWIAGQVGEGRVLYDGTIFLSSTNKPDPASGDHLKLALGAIRWLTQRENTAK